MFNQQSLVNTKKTVFLELCRKEMDLMQPFISILREEQESLLSANILAVDLLSDRKQSIIAKLAEHAAVRTKKFTSFGLKNASDIAAWVATSKEMQEVWNNLRGLLLQAKELHDANMHMLKTQTSYVEENANFFKQHVMTEEYDVYGELTPGVSGQRDLGLA